MKKKLLLLLLTVIASVFVCPVTAKAASFKYADDMWHFEYLSGIWVNGQEITNGGTVKCGNGTATLDKSTNPYTLTLTNAEISEWKVSGDFGLGISSDVSLNIVLVGTNTIKIKRDNFVVGITAPGISFYGDGYLAMDLKVRDVKRDYFNDYLSLYRQNAVGIESPYVYFYGGEYNLDCSDDLNYISYAILTDELYIANGQFSLFGSGGAFSKEPSYYSVGDGYPAFSAYAQVSSVKTGSGASSCSSGQKSDLQDWHKYVFFNAKAYCDTLRVNSIGAAIVGETVESTTYAVLGSGRGEIAVKGVSWYDASTGTQLSPATKFVSGKKYQIVIHFTSPIEGMFDNATKCPSFSGDAKATGKVVKQGNETVYVMTVEMKAKASLSPKVWINGERFTSNDPKVPSVSFDRASGVLTLNNAYITKYSAIEDDVFNGYAAIFSDEDLKIVLIGTNVIKLPQTSGHSNKWASTYAIVSNGNITIEGEGTLTISCAETERTYGIKADGDVSVSEQSTLTISSVEEGIYLSYGDLTNNGELTAYGKGTGIFAENGDLINYGNILVSSDNTPIYLIHGNMKSSGKQQVFGSAKVNDKLANLTDATFGTAKTTVKSSGKEALTIFLGIPGHKHVYNQKVESPEYLAEFATCNKNNVYYYSCSCGEKDTTRTFQSSKKGGHSFTVECIDKKYLKEAANCLAPALYYYKCAGCDEHGEEFFAYGEVGEHVFGEDNACTLCGFVKHIHVAELVEKVEPTCQKEGSETYYKCSCGMIFSDSECTEEIKDKKTLKIGKIDHIASEWITDTEAAVGVEGYHHKECTMCGKVLEEEAIPALKEECKHNNAEIKSAVTADCKTEGYSGDKICPDCGKVVETGSVVPMTDHDYDSEGVCKVCGSKDLNWKSEDTSSSTETPNIKSGENTDNQEGSTTTTVTTSDSKDGGNGSGVVEKKNFPWWIIVMVVVCLGEAVGFIIYIKKKKTK